MGRGWRLGHEAWDEKCWEFLIFMGFSWDVGGSLKEFDGFLVGFYWGFIDSNGFVVGSCWYFKESLSRKNMGFFH